MTNPYTQFVADAAGLLRAARSLPLGGLPPAPRPAPATDAPVALIFSPHPDDECIIGGLALRLLREAKFHVLNVAVTQGSNPARQGPRLEELKAACHYLGFGLIQTALTGLERIKPDVRAKDPAHWAACVKVIVGILRERQPRVVFFPHDDDFNSAHIGVHHLLVDALRTLGPEFATFVVETEFWHAMNGANLMVESSPADVVDLVTATSFHVGEVQRNPYHLRLPAWMQDNVRRGGEVVGGQGGTPPDYDFATLYRLRRWSGGRFVRAHDGGRLLPATENPAGLFA
jgi:LmbE family N-acetylglucosaminyl deacetylase